MKTRIVGMEIHAVEPAPYVERTYHEDLDDAVTDILIRFMGLIIGSLIIFNIIRAVIN